MATSPSETKFETVLILDTEGNHELREIGAILWNLRTNETIEFSSHLPHSIAKINEFKCLIAQCDAIVGHNVGCDRSKLKNNSINIDEKISICSYRNFQWPNDIESIGLKNICEQFNIDPIDIHSAIGDCRLLKQCLENVPDYFSQLQNAFEKKNKRQKIIQLINPDTKLVEFKNGQPILMQFLKMNGGLYEHSGNHDDGLTIPCPPTIELYSQKQIVENVKRLQFYIANEYPILVKRIRIRRHSLVLFIIGSKPNDSSGMDVDTPEQLTTPSPYIFKPNLKKRKNPWTTINLIAPGVKITPCAQTANVIARFRKKSNGNFYKCKVTTVHKIISTIQFPETIDIADKAKAIDNVEKMKTYIPNHTIRVDRIRDATTSGLLFTIGEPISKLCCVENNESKSESFHIHNQTNCDDTIFLKYLDENKYLLTSLQEEKLRFAPIWLNDLQFNIYWNTTTSTLKIIQDTS